MKQRTSALLSLGLCVILAVVALSMGISRSSSKKQTADGAEQPAQFIVTPAPSQDPEAETDEEGSGQGLLAGLFQKATPTPEPTATPSPTPLPTATPIPDPVVTQQPTAAPAGYFEDAAFLGNSVVTGLDMYDYDDVLEGADFYAANSVTVLGVTDYVREMEGHTYGKVYVGLGTNEMSYEKDTLRSCFNDMIQMIFDYNPDCIIYLMSVTPVSEYKSNSSSSFNKELVLEFNEMLQEIAKDWGNVYYLDVYSVLCNSDGYLPSDVTVDGIHFTPAHYSYWFDYLQTHYVSDSNTVDTETENTPGNEEYVEYSPAGEDS
jgi:hypothetical protein